MFEKEIEFKNILLEEEYNKIRASHFNNETPLILENYYLDNNKLTLINSRLMLRIRTQDNNQIMTLKVPESAHTVLEYSGHVNLDLLDESPLNQDDIPANIKEKLEALNISLEGLRIQGNLRTERLEKPYRSGLLVLDKADYLGQTDYELEFEAPDTASGQADITHILNKYDIVRREESVKSARFYEVLKRQKEGI